MAAGEQPIGTAPGGFVLLGDRPHDGQDDPLGFDGLVEALATLVLESRASTPFSIGVEAAWGMGKSTLMGRLCTRLAREQTITTVMFNAWTADGGGVLEGLVKTVLNELDDRVLRSALRNKQLLSWFRLATSVAGGLVGIGSVVDTVWERVASDPRARNELRALVDQAVSAWRSKQPEFAAERTLCVFVDDLDRCSPEGVLEVFEAMKLYLDVPGLVFIVGYDQDIVSDLVLRKKGYSETITGRDYLEKFIQIVYRVPRSTSEHAELLVDSLLRASRTTDLFGAVERALLIENNQFNPRRIKRFINGFVLAYGLDIRWREFEPQSLVRVQLLHMYFSEFAALLERRSEDDAIEEFLEYRGARDALRRGDHSGEAWSQVAKTLGSHGLPIPKQEATRNDEMILKSLEDNVPLAFVPLADREDFVALVQSLAKAADWGRLRLALAEGTLPRISPAAERETSPALARVSDMRFDGLKVVWVDDQLENIKDYADVLTAGGATVFLAENTQEAERPLRTGAVNVLISDMARGGEPDAGLIGLKHWRGEDLVPRWVIFFTSRNTRSLRRMAEEVGADLTADARELFTFLTAASLELGGRWSTAGEPGSIDATNVP
jgi:CheY-like chemotaxis protein